MSVSTCPDCGMVAEHDRYPHECAGERLRDAFAIAALSDLAATAHGDEADKIARRCYELADACVRARRVRA